MSTQMLIFGGYGQINIIALMKTLSFKIDDHIAAAFDSSPAINKRKINILINRWLRDLLSEDSLSSLLKSMDELSSERQKNGLTPEILEEILKDEK